MIREAGPAREDGKGAFGQPAVSELAAYTDALDGAGLVVFAGPLAGSEDGRIRVLLIAGADNEPAIRARLAGDARQRASPGRDDQHRAMELFVGAQRLAAHMRSNGEPARHALERLSGPPGHCYWPVTPSGALPLECTFSSSRCSVWCSRSIFPVVAGDRGLVSRWVMPFSRQIRSNSTSAGRGPAEPAGELLECH